MKIQEILDSEIPDVLYQTNWGWQGNFKWGEHLFTIQLSKIAAPAIPRLRTYEVSFFRTDMKGDDAYSSYDGQEEVPVKVYGVVLNAVRRAWREHDMDALFFTAEPRHSKDSEQHERKERIYSFLSQRVFRAEGGYLYVRRGDGQHYPTEWLLTREELPPNSYWTNTLQEGLDALPDGYIIKSI
jgi:hypothetical protein